eukprot:7383608-Prymnesium_polylepis.1
MANLPAPTRRSDAIVLYALAEPDGCPSATCWAHRAGLRGRWAHMEDAHLPSVQPQPQAQVKVPAVAWAPRARVCFVDAADAVPRLTPHEERPVHGHGHEAESSRVVDVRNRRVRDVHAHVRRPDRDVVQLLEAELRVRWSHEAHVASERSEPWEVAEELERAFEPRGTERQAIVALQQH